MPKKAQASTLENFFVSEGHRALYNEITYLKKRIHLVEGERKANYESNEALIKKNEAIIKEIKEKSKTLKESRKSVVDKHSNYFKKVAEVLGGEKKANEFRGKSCREVIDILQDKIGAMRNKLNIVDYKRAHYTQEMKDVLQMEGSLKKKLFTKNDHLDPRIEVLKATETSTAAMQMKTTEAENVRTRYKHMLRVLKDENYTQTINLREMEHLIEKQEKEIVRIQTVVHDANKARKVAKAQLMQVEEETIQEFSKREQELYEARMKLKIIRDKMESIGSKLSYPKFHIIHRDSSVTEGLTQDSKVDLGEGSKSQCIIEVVYNELQELTGESDPNFVIERFEKQRYHVKELVKEEQTMKSSVRKAKLRKRFLADKLGQLQYSGGLTREELNLKTEEINQEIESTAVERDHLDNLINEHTVMLEQMLSKLIEICQNNDLRVAPSSGSNDTTLGQKVTIILKHILQKTEQIVQEQNVSAPLLSPMSPLSAKRTSKVLGGLGIGMDINKEEDERLLGPDSTPPHRFGSTGDISSMAGHTDVSGMGSRRPSIADLSQLDSSLTLDKLVADAGEPTIAGIGAVSPISDSTTGFQLQLQVPEEDTRDDEKATKQTGFTPRGQESSEEEEAVTRNFVKRQSQILFEAKTRKGRFNPNSAPATRHRRY